jgi:hypothetical protein
VEYRLAGDSEVLQDALDGTGEVPGPAPFPFRFRCGLPVVCGQAAAGLDGGAGGGEALAGCPDGRGDLADGGVGAGAGGACVAVAVEYLVMAGVGFEPT